MFHIALYEPQIAPNTGNIIRLAANNGCQLHLIGQLGFSLEEKKLRRAGLDYHDLANITRHVTFKEFTVTMNGYRILAITTKGSSPYDQMGYQHDDVLLFGSETSGLPESVLESINVNCRLRIPMRPNSRTLNLSNAVAIVSYEAWRQHGFKGGI